MEEVSKSVSFTDPISAVFELNEDLRKRVGRINYLFEYAHVGGLVVLILSTVFLIAGLFNAWSFENLVFLGMALGASLAAWWFGRQEIRFLEEYRVRSAAVSRAKNWEPHPTIPAAPDPLDRLLSYLRDQDDRFANAYAKRPDRLETNKEAKGKSGKAHRFDACFDGALFMWRREPGPVVIFVRIVKAVQVEDVKLMKEAVEDVLGASGYNGPVRAIILQTESGEILEEAMLYANQHFLEYERVVGVKSVDWTSPVELIAEDPSRVYNIGSFYFG